MKQMLLSKPTLVVDKKYKEVKIEISFQLKEIQEKLKKHSKKQKDSNSWGYVGDLNHVKELLGQINDFLK